MKVGIYTLGCKVNMYESEYVIDKLKQNGYTIGDFEDICDIYIINTCTVTNSADSKSKKIIRSAIKRNKDACIVVMGCFIEANKDYQEDGVDIYLGTKDKSKIVSLLDEYFSKKTAIRDITNEEKKEFEDMFITTFEGRTRAFVKIFTSTSSSNIRNDAVTAEVSTTILYFNKVIKEVKTLTENGYQEIVLTGIHTGNYGVDLKTNFANLLKELVKIEKLKRLRISSIEVTELNDAVLEVIKSNKVIVDHLHIPLQAGSDEILKAMNRKYNLDYYKNKIKQIRSIRPDISISTDIIVGFPGEDEKLFEQTLKTAQSIAFSKIHVFPYSIRKNTKAASMPNQVDGKIKKERAKRLIELSKELEIEYMNKFVGKTVEVLTENNKDDITYGHTGNFLHVKINKVLPNDLLKMVKITSVSYPYVIGELIDE